MGSHGGLKGKLSHRDFSWRAGARQQRLRRAACCKDTRDPEKHIGISSKMPTRPVPPVAWPAVTQAVRGVAGRGCWALATESLGQSTANQLVGHPLCPGS